MVKLILAMLAVAATAGAQTNPAPKAEPKAAPSADAVIGYYRFKSGLDFNVYKNGDALTVKSTGQPPQVLTVSADGRFSYPGIPAYLTFDLDAKGVAKTLHFNFDEKSLPANRIDEKLAKEASDALALKIKNQTHDPKCLITLKRVLEELRTGKPDYSKMTLTLAQATRTQLPTLQSRMQTLGALKEAKFNAVGQQGAELFDLTFENGSAQFIAFCVGDGYISAAGMR